MRIRQRHVHQFPPPYLLQHRHSRHDRDTAAVQYELAHGEDGVGFQQRRDPTRNAVVQAVQHAPKLHFHGWEYQGITGAFVEPDTAPPGQHVPRRHDCPDSHRHRAYPADQCRGRRRPTQTDIQFPRFHEQGYLIRIRDVHGEGYPGMCPVHFGDQGGNESIAQVLQHADPDVSPTQSLQGIDLSQELPELALQAANARQHQLARRRQAHPSRQPFEQRHP